MKTTDNITPISKKQLEEYNDYALGKAHQFTVDIINKSRSIGDNDELILSRVCHTLELILVSFLASPLIKETSVPTITSGLSERILEMVIQVREQATYADNNNVEGK